MNQKSLDKKKTEPKKLECLEKEFFEFWDYVTNNDNWIKGRAVWKGCAYLTLGNCVKSFIQSLIQSTKEETIKKIMGIIDNNKLPYPNPYGDYIKVKIYNERLLPKIKEQINSLLKK